MMCDMKSAWITRFITAAIFFCLASAAVRAESVRSFDAQYDVKQDGLIQVEERITYDFGSLQRHGIYRDIETITPNAKGDLYQVTLSDITVSDENGNPLPVNTSHKRSKSSDQTSLRIGDPDRTISGEHVYVIHYTLSGAVTYFSDHDELYWNVTGNDWDVPIEQASVRVIVPPDSTGAAVLQTACYTGAAGSTATNCTATASGTSATYEASGFQSGEGMTVVAGFPKGLVAELEAKPYVAPKPSIWTIVLAILGVLFGIFWYIALPPWIIWKWYQQGRDPKVAGSGVVSAAFDPPKLANGQLLTPAETGSLIDEQVHARDITAAIVDLARRGYLRIEERKKKDWWLVKGVESKNKTDLQPHETIILDKLFASKQEVQLSKTDLTNMHTLATSSLNESMVLRGFFAKRPDKIRNPYYALAAVAMFTMNIVLALIAVFAGRAMPKKSNAGVVAANQAKSLKNFLNSQERQLEFQALNQMTFEKLLPYAVAFGVEKVWAKRFADVSFQQPSWYAPYSSDSTLNAAVFTRSLSSSMTRMTSAMTPTSSSTGHSSGFSGGFSGGGGGGGGGGSW